ncbi:alpha/beta hydrolase [Roseobacteraceae bacterium NS-SX3]
MDGRPMELEPAPFFGDLANGPEGGQAYWVKASDGLRLRVGHWQPEGADKGTLLLFPGRTEYIEKYGFAAAEMAARGYATLAVDWRGQGLADRMLGDRRLGHVVEFSDYQKDVDAMVALAERLDLPRPWFLLGHSMGGAIGLRAAMEGLPVKACVFTGPMWGIMIPRAMRPVASVLGRLAPLMGFSAMRAPTTTFEQYVQVNPFEGNTLTNDPEMYATMQAHMKAQPDLALGGPTIHWLSEGLKECAALARLPSPKLPCITFAGAQEQIVNLEAVRDRMRRWPGGELDIIGDAQHEVLMEGPAIRQHVFGKIAALFDAQAE